MKPTVLLLDENSAVQAIVSLTLNQLGAEVKTLTKLKNLSSVIRRLKPQLILCASDMEGLDPFSLASTLKKHPTTQNIRIIVLSPSDQVAELGKKVEDQELFGILSKPFQSDQLTRLVQRVLTSEESKPSLLMLLGDHFLQKLLVRLFEKQNFNYQLCISADEIANAVKHFSYSVIVVEWDAVEDLNWFDPDTMGELVLIIPSETQLKSINRKENVHIITRPLTYEKLSDAFGRLVPLDMEVTGFKGKQLDYGAQAMLAARITASIFERLVSHNALRDGDWDTAGTAAREELIRVCSEFEALFPLR